MMASVFQTEFRFFGFEKFLLSLWIECKLNKGFPYFLYIFFAFFDNFSKWSMLDDAEELWKIIKNDRNKRGNMKKTFVQIVFNPFFGSGFY